MYQLAHKGVEMQVKKKIGLVVSGASAGMAALLGNASAVFATCNGNPNLNTCNINGQVFCIPLNGTCNVQNNVGTQIAPGTGYASNIGFVINFGINVVMVIALLLVFGYLVMGGIQWITSGGEKGKTEEARNKITTAIIGLIVLAASYAVFQLVLRFLGFVDITTAINSIQPIQ